MTTTTNPYCDALGIRVPTVEAVVGHSEANTFALLIVALLERGGPMTLEEVASRLETAGAGTASDLLRSLKHCKPGRPPVYRDGRSYELDPHDDDLDLWAFRLGLRPPKVPRLRVVRPDPPPLPGDDVPVRLQELEAVFRRRPVGDWSAQRLALLALDALGRPVRPAAVVACLERLGAATSLSPDSARRWRGGAILVGDDGTWAVAPDHAFLLSARRALRGCLEVQRRRQDRFPDPAVIEANARAAERRREALVRELACLRRAIVHTCGRQRVEAAVIVDVARRRLQTFTGAEIDDAGKTLAAYDWIGAIGVRTVIRSLGLDTGQYRLAELGPPQKTMQLNRRGRSLRITTELLIRGSCGISRPLGDQRLLRKYLDQGQPGRLRRRLEADARSLVALYQFGRLHKGLRLRWGFLDTMLPVSWVHRDEPALRTMMAEAHDESRAMEVVTGTAPGWSDPWARAQRCAVVRTGRYSLGLVDDRGWELDLLEIQLARICAAAGASP